MSKKLRLDDTNKTQTHHCFACGTKWFGIIKWRSVINEPDGSTHFFWTNRFAWLYREKWR
jgi:hypothetical protein